MNLLVTMCCHSRNKYPDKRHYRLSTLGVKVELTLSKETCSVVKVLHK